VALAAGDLRGEGFDRFEEEIGIVGRGIADALIKAA
jgi:hypothetical protein